MNGRVYDPVLGRFLSADPNVDGVYDSQGYNRYSYCTNNPLNRTDPSGFFGLKEIGVIVAAVVVGIVTAGAALCAYAAMMGGTMVGGLAGAISSVGLAASWSGGWAVAAGAGFGFGSAFTASLLNGGSIGDAFKAGVIGGVVGGISAGIAGKIGDYAQNHEWFQGAGQNLAHGALQGGLTEATGGQFRHGFYAGFASSALAGPVGSLAPGGREGQTVAAAVVGGTASALGGGKFANGAVSGAFTYLFNHAVHPERSDADKRKVVGRIIVGEDQQMERVDDGVRVLGVRKTFFEQEVDQINERLAVDGVKVELVWANNKLELENELDRSSGLRGGLVTAFHGGSDEMLRVGREKVQDRWLIGRVGKVTDSPYLMLYCQPQKGFTQDAMVGFDFLRRNLGQLGGHK